MTGRAVILDRDGVILKSVPGYLKRARDAEFVPGSLRAIAMIQNVGIDVALATNQSGIASGEILGEEVLDIHARIESDLRQRGGHAFESIRVCSHAKDAGCSCRKPKPGLLLMAANDMSMDPRDCAYVGDFSDDWRAAICADMLPILVRTGRGREAENDVLSWYPGPLVRALTFDSLWDATDFLCEWGTR
jgi:D-glycero-D-manno-heptose 1,7-bisphosphate phosphatase